MSDDSNVNVTVNAPQPIIVKSQPGCLIQFLYFIFIGWWLGSFAIGLAYILFLTILGIPLGVQIINKIPYLMALRNTEPVISYAGEKTKQRNFFVRAIWFILIGWWFTGIWMAVAYLISLTIIGMPIGFWMFDRAPALLTLHR